MPIPKINLIPPAYYLRKKVKSALILSGVALVLVTAGLVVLAIYENSENQRLTQEQTRLETAKAEIDGIRQQATTATDAVKDVKTKTDFITSAFDANRNWAKVFENIRDYTYPGVYYTAIKPTPNGTGVALSIRIVENKRQPLIRITNIYAANLRRSPMIKAVAVASYPSATGDNSVAGTVSLTAPTGPSGVPMPGGPPMPGGVNMAGAPPGGRYIGSAQSLAGPALEGSAAYNASMMGGPGIQTLPGTQQGNTLGIAVPTGPQSYPAEVSVELTKPITIPTTGAARTQ